MESNIECCTDNMIETSVFRASCATYMTKCGKILEQAKAEQDRLQAVYAKLREQLYDNDSMKY